MDMSQKIAERSEIPEQPNAPLQAAMENKAAAFRQSERGPATASTGAEMALDFMNQGSAAGQFTTADINQHMPNFISADVHENDAGDVLFVDPNTGSLTPTDQNKHIALRDPQDGKIKIFGRTENTDRNAMESAGRLFSTGMGAGAPTARAFIPTPKPADILPRASDLLATSKPHYREFTAATKGIEVPKETAQGIADRLRLSLERIGIDDDMAGASAKAALRKLESGKITDFDELQRIKRTIDYGFKSPEKAVRDGAAAMVRELRQIISEVSPQGAQSLKIADDIHSTALAVQDLQRKAAVADLRKGRAGYGGNAVNSMRQVLSPIVQRSVEGKKTLYKPNEIAAMRDIVEGTNATNTLRLVGQASPTKGIMSTAASGGAAYAAGPVALAIPAIGAASNKLATVLTGKQIDRLKDLVSRRSPEYAKAVERAVKRYEDAQLKFINDPSPARLGAYVNASRQLANGLSRDGMTVTAGDLLRAIQGPVGAAAENEQR